ncbi:MULTISPECIES: MIP/aquaporin family protein [unclassified Modestobacter]
MAPIGLLTVFGSEVVGTGVLILLGTTVVANVNLVRTYGHAGAAVGVHLGWGLAVFAGVFAGASSGAHLNPAVTLGLLVSGTGEYATGVPVTVASTLVYVAGELTGAFLGAVLAWLIYRRHFALPTSDDPAEDAGTKLGTFATRPAIRSFPDNLVSEVIATFVLVYLVLRFGDTPVDLGPLAVALIVTGIGLGLGGTTGYAINPARDLGPRIAHALLPIRGKGGSDWGYAWVPIVGPLTGAVLAGLFSQVPI